MKKNSFIRFISQGHAIQLAIGIIIAGAIQEAISSFVTNVMFPFIGWVTGGANVSELQFHLGDNVIQYGLFFESIINFFVVGFGVYLFIKIYDKLQTTDILTNLDLVSREPKEIAEMTEVLKGIQQELQEIHKIQSELIENTKTVKKD